MQLQVNRAFTPPKPLPRSVFQVEAAIYCLLEEMMGGEEGVTHEREFYATKFSISLQNGTIVNIEIREDSETKKRAKEIVDPNVHKALESRLQVVENVVHALENDMADYIKSGVSPEDEDGSRQA